MVLSCGTEADMEKDKSFTNAMQRPSRSIDNALHI